MHFARNAWQAGRAGGCAKGTRAKGTRFLLHKPTSTTFQPNRNNLFVDFVADLYVSVWAQVFWAWKFAELKITHTAHNTAGGGGEVNSSKRTNGVSKSANELA